MTQPTPPAPVGPPHGDGPPLDVMAILAAQQDQIDDLTAAVEAQQRTIDELVRNQRGGPPAGDGQLRPDGVGDGLR